MNPQIPAAVLAALVAWRTRSTLLTLVVGMGVLWALKHWGL
jgi:branched-subunit amino acid transport protein